jgi:uncharacterized protein (TIGR02145 family)
MNGVKLILLTAISMATAFAFLACEKKDKKADTGGEVKAQKAEVQQNAFDGSIAAKVEGGSSLSSEIKDLWIFSEKGDRFPVTGSYADGGFAVTLPEKPNEKYMHSVNRIFYDASEISDRSANIFIFNEIHGLGKNGSLVAIFKPYEIAEGDGSLERNYTSFYYSDRDVIIQSNNVNLDLKNGWNKVYTSVNMHSGDFTRVSSSQEARWRLLYETKGNVEIKLPEADSDQLRYVALCVSSGEPSYLYDWAVDDFTTTWDKLGYGEAFKFFAKQAYDQRGKDLDGWLQNIVKLVAPLVPHKMYVSSGWDRMVRHLLAAYDDLATNPGSFRQVYDIMSDKRWGGYGFAYNELFRVSPNKQLEAFFHENESKTVNEWAFAWAYSFWGRRYNENPKNVEPIAASLRLFRNEVAAQKKLESSHSYKTVKIGKQTWMAENLNIKTGVSWCYGKNESNCKKYGRLYDWATAKGACPSGWHLPTREEWEELIEAIGGDDDFAGKKLKSKTGWGGHEGSGNGTDDFGFSAMPGGARHPESGFMGIDSLGGWWSATERGEDGLGARYLWTTIASDREDMRGSDDEKNLSMSVRCVKD